jgi:hypothetical protein
VAVWPCGRVRLCAVCARPGRQVAQPGRSLQLNSMRPPGPPTAAIEPSKQQATWTKIKQRQTTERASPASSEQVERGAATKLSEQRHVSVSSNAAKQAAAYPSDKRCEWGSEGRASGLPGSVYNGGVRRELGPFFWGRGFHYRPSSGRHGQRTQPVVDGRTQLRRASKSAVG